MSNITRRAAITSVVGATACASAYLMGCGGSQTPAQPVSSNPAPPASTPTTADVVVFGATPSGILASMAAARMGASVVLIEPTQHVGGATTSGLGVADTIDHASIAGLTAQFYLDIAAQYGDTSGTSQYRFEPHVAEALFLKYIAKSGIKLIKGVTVAAVSKSGTQIQSVGLSDSSVVMGTQWIDASYEGDLMALAGASYTVGRESTSQYTKALPAGAIRRPSCPSPSPMQTAIPGPTRCPIPMRRLARATA